jgi:hypothetical protein
VWVHEKRRHHKHRRSLWRIYVQESSAPKRVCRTNCELRKCSMQAVSLRRSIMLSFPSFQVRWESLMGPLTNGYAAARCKAR